MVTCPLCKKAGFWGFYRIQCSTTGCDNYSEASPRVVDPEPVTVKSDKIKKKIAIWDESSPDTTQHKNGVYRFNETILVDWESPGFNGATASAAIMTRNIQPLIDAGITHVLFRGVLQTLKERFDKCWRSENAPQSLRNSMPEWEE